MTKEECTIIIDKAEKEFGLKIANILVTKCNRKPDNIKIEELDVGDFKIISPDGLITFTIERKSDKDFRSSFSDGRLSRQSVELSQEQNGIILVHDNIFQHSLWKGTSMKVPDSVTKYLMSLTIKRVSKSNKIQIVQLPFKSQVVVAINQIAEKIEMDELEIKYYQTSKKENRMKIDKNSEEYHDIVLYDNFKRIDRMPKEVALELVKRIDYDFDNFYKMSIEDLKNLKIKGFGKVLIKRTYETYHGKTYTENKK
jgi:ERCC4-type nuclease